VNSGWITSGNVEPDRCLEYAAIGDAVITASRSERLTKGYPFGALPTDDGRQWPTLPTDDLTLRDTVTRGRAVPTVLWGLGVR
jgi:hypothetical protein